MNNGYRLRYNINSTSASNFTMYFSITKSEYWKSIFHLSDMEVSNWTDTWPILGLYFADTWPTLDRYLADTRPTMDRYLADTWPIRKWFEPRSNIPWLKKIIWVIGVLLRTPITQMIFFNHGTWPIVGRQLIATYRPMHRPTVDRQIGRYIGRLSADHRSTTGRQSVDCRPTVDRLAPESRSTVDRYSGRHSGRYIDRGHL